MKKITSYFLFLFTSVLMAQTPTYFNTNVAAGQNSIPLSSGTQLVWRKAQFFIPTGSLGSVPSGNNITKIYFQAGSGATVTYPDLYVRLKTGTGTGFTAAAGGAFETGLTTVFHGVNFVMTTLTNNWYAITLQTPFLFDPTKPLYVEIEHNHTNAAGPTVCQNAVIPGPGNGRAWGDYATANNTGVGTNQLNFGIDVIPATPCLGSPAANSSAFGTFTTCPNMANPLLGLTNTYSLGGLTYAWQTSTSSPVGPYTPVTGSLSTIQIPTLGVTTWYQAVVTCTNAGGGTTSLTPTKFFVAGSVVNTAPYSENFDAILSPGFLPNCSWAMSNSVTCLTYTSSNTFGRSPNSGNNFASFYNTPSGVNYFYTNGINMTAGITYSAGVMYKTESVGYNNWTDLSILYGTTQTPTGLISIVSTNGPAVASTGYRALGATFQVATSGMYYVALRGTSIAGNAPYLTLDDVSISIPCSLNSPTVTLTANTTSICANDAVNLSAGGANTYSWSTGATTGNITDLPTTTTTYYVIGTSALSGCTSVASQVITVNPSPTVFVYSLNHDVCAGQSAALSAIGSPGCTYVWSNNANGANVTVLPTSSNNSYTVLATNAFGCVGMAAETISVHTLPLISVTPVNDICVGETAVITAMGGVSYLWTEGTSGINLLGNPVNVSPIAPTVYTVTGTDGFGCSNKQTVALNVNQCTGLAVNKINGLSVYPNPTSGAIAVELNNTSAKTVLLMDLTGRIISSSSSSEKVVKVNLSALSNGIYYLKIQSEAAVEVVKVVKQ